MVMGGSLVRVPALYTGWTFSHYFVKINEKEAEDGPFKKTMLNNVIWRLNEETLDRDVVSSNPCLVLPNARWYFLAFTRCKIKQLEKNVKTQGMPGI